MKRTLTLRREALAELGTDALAAVGAGLGDQQPTPPQYAPPTLVLEECFAISAYLHCGDITASPRCV